ncbi:SOS response-associated peptidase family protein [Sphingomonas kyeonggiensis]|uniref:Abasic site processing protein n=1 Tax=Sphingomonas kyeonggiensis TaxID=1268553 RepID=A0A7W6JQ01_9SPHN|nr:SOS response-associated peptidase [Sphingomonas kyeonggiensis]MBB4097458.1 putative SOS response-associated peptidase YedK [Sphingomonas kyeonggiensis]
MCNDYRLEVDIASIMEDFDELEIAIELPEGTPNVEVREDIKITDVAPIVRTAEGRPRIGELVNRRWSWPGQRGKPVYNFQADNREFTSNRCLILADGFYEFTDPEAPKQKRLDKWLFTLADHRWFCIAGIWRKHPELGEAFTMLTLPAGPDIAPYHHRQIIPLTRDRWADWLDPAVPAEEILRYLPKGSLTATRVYPPAASAEASQPGLDLDAP